jgi:hypothetical protein
MSLPVPSHVAVVAARIPQFARLGASDRLRAAALALKRDFGVESDALRVAPREIDMSADDGRVLIAYSTSRDTAAAVNLSWAASVARDTIFWDTTSGAQSESTIYSDQGVARIEPWRAGNEPPSSLVALIAARTRAKHATRVVVDAERDAIDDATLAHWSASLGANFERGRLPLDNGANEATPLLAVPRVSAQTPSGAIDRALKFVVVAAFACATIAIARFLSAPTATLSAAMPPVGAGELWTRATLAAPQLVEHAKSATFGGGAWIIAAPSLPVNDLAAIEAALSANGLATQIVREPELRIRVQRP